MKRLVLRYCRATDDEADVREAITPPGFVFVLGKGRTPVIVAVSELVAVELIDDEAESPTGEGVPAPETVGVPFPLAPVPSPRPNSHGVSSGNARSTSARARRSASSSRCNAGKARTSPRR